MKIGVLASQGAFAEHIATLKQLAIEAVPVRLPRELRGVDGLIIPGGESTSISGLMSSYDLMGEITSKARDGVPLFGTCAGMILMSRYISGNTTKSLALMDITVKRNAFITHLHKMRSSQNAKSRKPPCLYFAFSRLRTFCSLPSLRARGHLQCRKINCYARARA